MFRVLRLIRLSIVRNPLGLKPISRLDIALIHQPPSLRLKLFSVDKLSDGELVHSNPKADHDQGQQTKNPEGEIFHLNGVDNPENKH